jgi:two-component system, LuxR family, sensor kinase FixL
LPVDVASVDSASKSEDMSTPSDELPTGARTAQARAGLSTIPWLTEAAELGAFLIAYYVAYRFGMSFSDASSAPFWFPDSVLLCALLVVRPSRWWLYVAAALPIRFFSEVSTGVPTWFLLATFAIDVAKAVVAAAALRRLLDDPLRWRTIRDFLVFCAVAVVLVPAASAFAGAAARSARGFDYWVAWEEWLLGDALAQLVITPLILYWLVRPPQLKVTNFGRVGEAALLLLGLVASGYWAMHTGDDATGAASRLYAPVPFLFWAAIRFGMRGASGAVGVIAILAVHAALTGEQSFVRSSPAATALGLQQLLLLWAVPLCLVAVLIEQRDATAAALGESEQRFREMANSAPVLMWTAGADGRAEFFNQKWLDFTGRPLDAELGDGWRSSIHPEDRAHYDEARQRAVTQAQPSFEIEYRLQRTDGAYRWMLQSTALRHGSASRVLGHVSTAVDITERKQAEEISRNITHVQRLATLGELTALIAHEVRQPLTAALLNLDAAQHLLQTRDTSTDEFKEILHDLRDDTLRAADAIRHIRDLVQRHRTEMLPLEANDIVVDVLRLVAGDALRRRVEIVAELASYLPYVRGDAAQLQHVLLNLINNAMDALGDSQGAHTITVRTRTEADGIEVAVSDTGRGIPPEALPRLFESFYSTRTHGLGLGLTIARGIITAHGGQISAANNPTGGATFRFTIPAMTQDASLTSS